MMKLYEIIDIMNKIAPPELAYINDRIGLQVGDTTTEIHNIAVAVDVTPFVIDESVKRSANLIISHHPLIYDPLPNLRTDKYPQSLVIKLIKSNISLFTAHTNYDMAAGGINDSLAAKLGIRNTEILVPDRYESQYKLVVYVPTEFVQSIKEAFIQTGLGIAGNYSGCSFQSAGIGSFIPNADSSPYIGTANIQESVDEIKLEIPISEKQIDIAIKTIKKINPYEEPVYDIYKLETKGKTFGLGLVGDLGKPISFSDLREFTMKSLKTNEIRSTGDPNAIIHRIAVMGGSGGSEIESAKHVGADAYITGDVKHSQLLHANALGLCVIDAGHFHTEQPGMESLVPVLNECLNNVKIEYIDSCI